MAVGVHRGDQLRGEKISIEAMEIDFKGVIRRTSKHRGQWAVAKRNVLCVIEKEMILAKGTKPMQRS